MAGEITSRFAIDVTVERLKQLQDLRVSLEQIIKLAQESKPTITLNIDTKDFDQKLKAAQDRAKSTTVNVGGTGGTGGGSRSRAGAEAPQIKLNLGKVEASLRGIQTTLTALLTATKGNKPLAAKGPATVKFDTGMFSKSVTRFDNTVTKLATATSDLKAAAASLKKLKLEAPKGGGTGGGGKGGRAGSDAAAEERAIRQMVRRRYLEDADYRRQEKAAENRKKFLDRQRQAAINYQEREAYRQQDEELKPDYRALRRYGPDLYREVPGRLQERFERIYGEKGEDFFAKVRRAAEREAYAEHAARYPAPKKTRPAATTEEIVRRRQFVRPEDDVTLFRRFNPKAIEATVERDWERAIAAERSMLKARQEAADKEKARIKERNTRALVNERYREDAQARRAARREPYAEARANARIDTEQAARAYSGQFGFAGFVGNDLTTKARAFVKVLNESLTGLNGSISNYNLKLKRLEEAATPTQTQASLRQLGRQGLDVRSRQAQVAGLVDVAAQQGLPGADQFRDLLQRYGAAREDRIRQQALLFRTNRAEDLSRDAELSPERRQKFADKAARLKAEAQAQGITNKTVKEAIQLEEQLVRVLNLSANSFAKQANETLKSRDALQHFNDRLTSLARFAGAGALLFTVTSTLTNAFSETVKLEAAFRRIQGILPGRSISDRLKIEEGTLKAAQDFAANIEDAVKNAQLFAQTGIGPEATIQETRSALAAARGGGIDQGQAVETAIATRAVSAIEGLNQSLASSQDIFTRIARIEATTAATGQDLAVSVQRLGALVKATQPTPLGTVDAFDTLLGNVAEIVTTTRVTGSQAQTALKFIISRLSAPDVSKQLQNRFGIRLADETGKGARPLSDILSDISDEFKRLRETGQTRKAQELLVTVAGGRQLGIATALFENFNRSLAYAQESSLAMGDIQARVALQMDTLEARTTQLSNAFTVFFRNLLEQSGILKGLTKGAKFGAETLETASKNPVASTVLTAVGLFAADAVLSRVSGRLATNVEGRRLKVDAANAQANAVKEAGFGVAAGIGAGLGQSVALRGLSKLSLLLRGVTGITGLWPVFAFTAGVAALGFVLNKISEHKEQFEGISFNFQPPKQQDINETIGADLNRFGRALGTSPTGVIRGVDVAIQNTLNNTELRKKFPNLDQLLSLNAEGRPKETDTRLFKEFTKEFTAQLAEAIPGLQAITDETDRVATAMRLLRASIQFGSIQGEANQAEVLAKTSKFIDLLSTRLSPKTLAIPSEAGTDVQSRILKALATGQDRVGDILRYSQNGTRAGLSSKTAADIGFAYGPQTIQYLERFKGLRLLDRGNNLLSNNYPAVQGQIKTILDQLLPEFPGLLTNLQGLKDSSGNAVNAIQFLATNVAKNGLTLGQALDAFSEQFLSIQGNRDIFKESILADLRKIPTEGGAPLAPATQGAVGGEVFLQTFFDLIRESSEQLAKEYRARGQSTKAIQQETIARALNDKGQRGRAFSQIQGNLRGGFIRDRLIEILGQFAIREQGIRFSESRVRPEAGRGFDADQERLRSIEQLTDALGIVGAQTRLDLVRINSRLSQASQFTVDNIASIVAKDIAEESDTGRASTVQLKGGENERLPISDELKSLRTQQATLQAAILALAPDSREEVLQAATKGEAEDKQFLLESLFREIKTVQDARDFQVTMKRLTDASIAEEKARRDIIIALEREAEIIREDGELRLTAIRQSQALDQVQRDARIRRAEIGGTLVPFGENAKSGLLRPQSQYRIRGSLASLGLRADDIQARSLELKQLAEETRRNAFNDIDNQRKRGASTDTIAKLTQKAEFDFKSAVLAADNEATVSLARLLEEERANILADTASAIRTAVDAGTQGLRDVLSSFQSLTEGNFFERLLGPAASTITGGFANLLSDNLVGPNGVFAKQVEALFGRPAKLAEAQREAELQAAILSSSALQALRQGGDYVGQQIREALGEGATITPDKQELRTGTDPGGTLTPYSPDFIRDQQANLRDLLARKDIKDLITFVGAPRGGITLGRNDGSALAAYYPKQDRIQVNPNTFRDGRKGTEELTHELGHRLSYRDAGLSAAFRRELFTEGVNPSNLYGQNFQELFARSFAEAKGLLDDPEWQAAIKRNNTTLTGFKDELGVNKRTGFFMDYLLSQSNLYNEHPLKGQAVFRGDVAAFGTRDIDKAIKAQLGDELDFKETQDRTLIAKQASENLLAMERGGDYVYKRIVDAFSQFAPELPVGPPTAQERAQQALGGVVSPSATSYEALTGQLGYTGIPAILGGATTQNGVVLPQRGNLVAGAGGVTTPGYYGNAPGTFVQDASRVFASAVGDTRKARLDSIKKSAAGLIGAYGGAAIGGAIGGKGKNSYASEGAALGSGIGGLVAGPVGSIIGGIGGGIIGGLFGKHKPKVTPELAILEKIDRGIRAQTAVIENGNRNLLSLDSRLLNAPASFALTGYRPLNAGGGNASPAGTTFKPGPTYTLYIDARGATNPEQVEARVNRAVAKGLRHEGSYLNRNF